MWLHTIVHLVLMLVGFGSGSAAWLSAYPSHYDGRAYWWFGGLIGMGIGWAIAAGVMATIRDVTQRTTETIADRRSTPTNAASIGESVVGDTPAANFGQCPHCQNWVSTDQETCPHCNQPLRISADVSQSEPDNPKLMSCPDCGRKVSRRAPTCPGCGAPLSAE